MRSLAALPGSRANLYALGPEAVWVIDGDVPATCHRPGEGHHPVGGGSDRGPRRSGDVDAPVARTEWTGRGLEGPAPATDAVLRWVPL
jgi:hypothetical protein